MPSTQRAYDHVAGIYFPIAIGVFAAVILTLVAFLVMGARRRSAGKKHEAKRAESAYAAILACVVAFLVWLTFSRETPIDRLVSQPTLHLRVTAGQWAWHFHYPNGIAVNAVSTWNAPEAVVPAGVEIQIDGTSSDVIHGFWVPGVHYMRQLFPGYVSRFDMLFPKPGRYLGECSVYCGENHTQMHFAIRAVSADAFRSWMASGGRSL
jgi:cytochrome c oxidase subunit II